MSSVTDKWIQKLYQSWLLIDLEYISGKSLTYTWSLLDGTAQVGDTSITLQDTVDWQVGDVITIASTGDKLSTHQNEVSTFIFIIQIMITY